ncbi:MAG TPA: hypothetical protein DEP45_13205 [Armatimonadetes bacterium]|nr:hypothetical protein [Armatimonadota bacterium]
MRTAAVLVVVLSLLVSAWAIAALTVNIQVAPAQIVLSAPLEWITVHADIAYADVDPDSVTINGLDDLWIKSDNCGNLVAKVRFVDIVSQLSAPSAVIVLEGETTDGEAFSGSQTVRVK